MPHNAGDTGALAWDNGVDSSIAANLAVDAAQTAAAAAETARAQAAEAAAVAGAATPAALTAETTRATTAEGADAALVAAEAATARAAEGTKATAGSVTSEASTARTNESANATAAAAAQTTANAASPAMIVTPVKTTTYTALANQLIPADATSAPFTITLPTAPADKTRVTVKKIDASTNLVTVAAAGSDVFNVAAGVTTKTLTLLNQAATYQYATTGAIWYASSDDIPLSGLDARFLTPTVANSTYVTLLTCTGAGDETAKINAWLAASTPLGVKKLVGPPSISTPLVVPSNTYLDATTATVTLLAASNCNLLNNAAVTPTASAADGSMTAASAVLTSATLAAVAVVGQSVTVAGATTNGYVLVSNIVSVNAGANQVTLALPAGTTVAAAAVALYTRDKNISVVGGTWARGSNAGAGTALHSLRFRHADGIKVLDVTVTSSAGKYAVNFADCTNFHVNRPTFATFSDGVHITGPCSNFSIRNVFGTTGDDSVAMTANDYPAYADSVGPISDGVIENLFTASGSRMCIVNAGASDTSTKRIRIRHVFGSTSAQPAVLIADDNAYPNTQGGRFDAISVEHLSTSTPNNQPAIMLTGINTGRVRIRGVSWDNASATIAPIRVNPASAGTFDAITIADVTVAAQGAAQPIIDVGTFATVKKITVDGLQYDSANAIVGVVNTGGNVTDLTISKVSGNATGSTNLVNMNGAAARIDRVTISDLHMIGTGGNVVTAPTAGQTLPNVEISNATLTGLGWVADFATTTELHLSNVTHKSPTAGILNARATAVVTLTGDGTALTKGGSGIAVAAGGKVAVRLWDVPPAVAAGGFPTIAAGAGAGTGATVAVAGSDRAGSITVTLGTTPAAGFMCTLTFIGTWPQIPKMMLTPTNAAAQAVGLYLSSKTTTTFIVSSANVPGGNLTFDYLIAA